MDVVATARYLDDFHEILVRDPFFPHGKKEHWVNHTWFFDAQESYDFRSTASADASHGAGWKQWLNNSSLTVGCNNVFGQDPPNAYGESFTNPLGYPGSIYDSTGRFVYFTLKKVF